MARTEEFKVSGDDVMKKIKDLIKEGNIRKITIKDKDGKNIAEFPLTLGVIGTVVLPVLAAIGTIIALVTECTISVEREEKATETEAEDSEENDNSGST
jgi:hypothetical protein